MDGPKNREAELVLARHAIGPRDEPWGAFVCKKGGGLLPPVRRLRGIGELLAEGGGTL